MIAETLYKIAKDLFNIFTKLDDARLQRTIRVAEYFSNLAQIIEDTSAYLKKGIYPHGECRLLLSHAENMVEAIGDLIGNNEAQKHAEKLEAPIFQPFVEGKEISIDAYVDNSNDVKGVVLRFREIVVQGESQVTTSFQNEEIQSTVTEILESLKLRGPVVMQAILDETNQLHIIECNPRFGGASTTAIAAGLDIWYWAILEASGVDISEYPYFRVPREVKQIRMAHDSHIYDSDF